MECHSRDHGRLHVHVSEHSPLIALTGHVKLAHMLDSSVGVHISSFTLHCTGRIKNSCNLHSPCERDGWWTVGCGHVHSCGRLCLRKSTTAPPPRQKKTNSLVDSCFALNDVTIAMIVEVTLENRTPRSTTIWSWIGTGIARIRCTMRSM